MGPTNNVPPRGSIPVAAGLPATVRIPVPGTDRLCIELGPRGWTPTGGSTSTLFIQDITGKRNLRLDYGYNVKTRAIDFHWNQKGTFAEFGIADHAAAGKAGAGLYKAAKCFRYGGRVLLVVGVAASVYSVVVASNPLRQAAKEVAGWAGAWAGCEVAGAGGAAAGTFVTPGVGTAVGGIGGCVVGGFIGYWGASSATGRVYDWAAGTIFRRVPETTRP